MNRGSRITNILKLPKINLINGPKIFRMANRKPHTNLWMDETPVDIL